MGLPVLQRLRSYGRVLPLVVGHFGEWNEELGRLVVALADDAAPRMAALFGASSAAAIRRNEAARMDDQANERCRDSAAHWSSRHRPQGVGPWTQAFRD